MTVFVLAAHSDDDVLGVGGTIVKYVREGTEVVTVIFSRGEKSHPWIKSSFTVDARKKETERVTQILGVKKNINLDVPDGTLLLETNQKEIHDKLVALVKEYKPDKIFTHAVDDPHPDHHAVYKIVSEVFSKIRYSGHIYSFEVWNPMNIMKRKLPVMYVDISETFKAKIKALKSFESQKIYILPLLPVTYLRAKLAGLKAKCKYAEAFYIIK
jgi:LmbE family N-acetylglucosaminyl deacetylase